MTNPLDHLRLSLKLAVIVATMALFIAVVSVTGYLSVGGVYADLRAIYIDRTVPVTEISAILDAVHRVRTGVMQLASEENPAAATRIVTEFAELDRVVDLQWTSYRASYATQEEIKLADKTAELLKSYRIVRDKLVKAQRSDREGMSREATQIFTTLTDNLRDLIVIQQKEAEKLYRNAQEEKDATDFFLFLVAGLSLLAGTIVSWVIARSVTGALDRAVAAMRQLAADNTDVTVEGTHRRDEVGEIVRALETFRGGIVERKTMAAERRDAERRSQEERRAAMERLAGEFERTVGAVVSAVSDAAARMRGSAGAMTSTAVKTRENALAASSAADQASANVNAVASATEELAGSIREISRSVSESTKVAGGAVDQARRTDATVTSLSEAAIRIGDVVKLIGSIASQTNLLALNATIEAARAGEAGRGFAVVASEVKNLANQTSKATDEIQNQIGQMQSVTHDAVGAIREIAGTITRIDEISTGIASAIEEQGAATQEIARNVQQASEGTREVSVNVDAVRTAASEAESSATDVMAAADGLARQADTLQREVQQFIRRVRTA